MDRVERLKLHLASGGVVTEQEWRNIIRYGAYQCAHWLLEHYPQFTVKGFKSLVWIARRIATPTLLPHVPDAYIVEKERVRHLFVCLIKAGANFEGKNKKGNSAIECLYYGFSGENLTAMHLFIDYGSPPALFRHKREDDLTIGARLLRAASVYDWSARKLTRVWLYYRVFPTLIGVLWKRLLVPKQIATLITRSPELHDPSAWRAWGNADTPLNHL